MYITFQTRDHKACMTKKLSTSWSIIESIDLSNIQKALVSTYGWSEEDALLAHKYYKQYLYLKKEYGHQYLLPPSTVIDEFWHLHIIDTNSYMEHCIDIFGHYLHHTPSYSLYNVNIDINKEFEITKNLFFKIFNKKL